MRKTKLLLTFFILQSITLSAQVKVTGKISDQSGKIISYAAVALLNINDTTKVVASSITDEKGIYSFENISPKEYKIYASFLGYKPCSSITKVTRPSNGNEFVKNIILEEQALLLGEVTVEAKASIEHKLDREIYNITAKQRKSTTTGLDLVNNLPNLVVDYNSQSISTIDFKSVKVLINGASASGRELTTLEPKNIKRVEYFDLPPAKYSSYASVVNIITKHPNDGIYGGVNGISAVTTGFVNAGGYVNYNWGHNQIKFNAFTNFRDYTDVCRTQFYKYKTADYLYTINETNHAKFGYDDNFLSLQFLRNVPEKYMLQVKFNPNFQHTHDNGELTINKLKNDINHDITGVVRDHTKQFTPSLDIYSVIKFPKNSELTLNLTTTFIDASQDHKRIDRIKETSDIDVEDYLHSKNKKISNILFVNYQKYLGKNYAINIGNKTSLSYLSYKVNDTKNYTRRTFTNSYAEIQGTLNRLSFRANITASYYKNETNELNQNNWKFEPQALLGYKFNNHHSIRLTYEKRTFNPSLNKLNTAQIYIAENLYKQGNPSLKNSTSNNAVFNYDYSLGNQLSIRTSVSYVKKKDPFNSYFVREGNKITLRRENAISHTSKTAMIRAYYDPFKNHLLAFNLAAEKSYITIRSQEMGTYKGQEFHFNYSIISKIKNFTIAYSGNIRDWVASGAYQRLGEKNSACGVSYQYKNMSFSASCFWLFATADYESKTLENSIVDDRSRNVIRDNKNMITFGFSYRFGVGKKHKSGTRKYNHSDRDAGLF